VELLGQAGGRRLRLGVHLIQSIVVSALFLRQPGERAEDAGLPQIADVRRVYVLIGGEGDHVAVLTTVGIVGEHPHSEQIRRCEEELGIRVG